MKPEFKVLVDRLGRERVLDLAADEIGRLIDIEQRLKDCIAITQDVPSDTPTEYAKLQEMLHYVLTGKPDHLV